MFSEEKLPKIGYINNSINKLPIKMFIKRETMAGKAYAYGKSLNIKTSVPCNFF